jgi:hypothetical protein
MVQSRDDSNFELLMLLITMFKRQAGNFKTLHNNCVKTYQSA